MVAERDEVIFAGIMSLTYGGVPPQVSRALVGVHPILPGHSVQSLRGDLRARHRDGTVGKTLLS